MGVTMIDDKENTPHYFFWGFNARNGDIYVDARISIINYSQEEISAIVLGESYNQFGQKNKIMGSIEEFKRNIEADLDIPVYFEQEFMTSMHSSEQKFKDIFIAKKIKKVASSATRRGGGRNKDDSKAATLILQRFLERKNNNK
jgi:RNase H-fold protein (predicted Holliday junction resolvase)